jgi:acetate---CoA ligase (ADP-forming)
MDLPPWLDAMSEPRSVALIGVSDDATKVSGRALAYLKRYQYAGEIFPINNRVTTVQGMQAYARVSETPTPPELALVSLPASRVEESLNACIESGVKTAIVYASGFAEQDDAGWRTQERLKELIRGSTMRVLGPNCLGAVSARSRVTATFATAFDDGSLEPGPVALLTQSGAFASFVYGKGRAAGVGFGFLATTGNEMDLTLSDLLAGVVEMPDIKAVLLHIESIRSLDRFEAAAARARALGKPVAAVKVGRSPAGARAAKAHTNADVGDHAVYAEIFEATGVRQVESMAELADAGLVFQANSAPDRNRVAIVSVSGGTGVLMADVAAQRHLEVPTLSAAIRDRVGAMLPPFASTINPVDVTGAVFDDLATFERVLAACAEDPDTDMLLVAVGNAVATEEVITDALLSVAGRFAKPTFVAWVGGSGEPARRLIAAGIPTFDDPSRAVVAASLAVKR